MGKVQTCLTHVEVNTNTNKEERTKNKEVGDACHNYNRRKFSQAYNIPLMQVWIAQEIVFYVTYGSCLKVLQGHSNVLPDIDYHTTAYLKHLRRDRDIIEPPQAIVPKNIPGRTVKHERTYLRWHIRPTLCTPQSMFTVTRPSFNILGLPLPYPLHNRICTRGLEKSINVMLENKGKGVLASNIRTICLIEAGFNFNNNILARDLMQCTYIIRNPPK